MKLCFLSYYPEEILVDVVVNDVLVESRLLLSTRTPYSVDVDLPEDQAKISVYRSADETDRKHQKHWLGTMIGYMLSLLFFVLSFDSLKSFAYELMDEIKCTCVIKGDRQQSKVQIDYKEFTRHEDFYYFRISFDRESNCFLEWDIASNRLRKLYRQWILKWITISFPALSVLAFFVIFLLMKDIVWAVPICGALLLFLTCCLIQKIAKGKKEYQYFCKKNRVDTIDELFG